MLYNDLQFEWIKNNSTARDNMIAVFKEKNIRFDTDAYGSLRGAIGDNGQMVRVEYYLIENNLFGITAKPRSTSEYFGLTPEQLYVRNSDDYTKEEALLCDHNVHAKPFACSLANALAKAKDYADIGCEGIEILQMINGNYAVVCH